MSFGASIGRQGGDVAQCWRTPQELFDKLDSIFHFTIDACADDSNHLCERYWTAEDDCRLQDWSGEIVFCNPPFKLTGSIIPKAKEAATAVFLLPLTALTTKYVGANPPNTICIPSYRIKFIHPTGERVSQPTLGTIFLIYGDCNILKQLELKEIGQIFESLD